MRLLAKVLGLSPPCTSLRRLRNVETMAWSANGTITQELKLSQRCLAAAFEAQCIVGRGQ